MKPLSDEELASIRKRAGTRGAFGGIGPEETQRLLATVDYWKGEADAERKLRREGAAQPALDEYGRMRDEGLHVARARERIPR